VCRRPSSQHALEIGRERNAMAIPIVMAARAEILLAAGRLEDAEHAIQQSTIERLPGLLHFAAAANGEILSGRLAAIRGDHARAVEIADRVCEWLRPLGVKPYDPAALLLKGTSLIAMGRIDDAEAALLEGRTEAERLGFIPILWRIDMALSGLAASAGDEARAAELRDEASDIVAQIANSIDDLELRASFLGLPDVGAVNAP